MIPIFAQAIPGTEGTATPIADAPTTPEEIADSVVDTLMRIWTDFVDHLPLIGVGVVVIVVTGAAAHLFNGIAGRILRPVKVRNSLKELIKRFIYIAIWAIGLLIAAIIVFPGITPGRALATMGLGSIAIGFAFKDIFENFFAGVLLLWRFPFENGDFILCNGIEGKVEDVTIRNTLIRKTTGELVVVPNATLFKNPVDVLTNWNRRRQTVICGVAYDVDVDQARGVIEAAVKTCKSVKQEEPVQVFAQEFAESSINFEVTWWSAPRPVDARSSRDEVVAAVKKALDRANIEIPFPYRTLTFKEPLQTEGISGRTSSKTSEE